MLARPHPLLESLQAVGHVLARVVVTTLGLAALLGVLGAIRALGEPPMMAPVFETDPAWYLALRRGVIAGSAAGVMLGALQGLFGCAGYGAPARWIGSAFAGAVLGARGIRFHTEDPGATLAAALIGAVLGAFVGEVSVRRATAPAATASTR